MAQDKKYPIPLLILSDAPTAGTGLARITRDLAIRIARNMSDVFRVATIGYGGIVSRHLPFHQYIAEGMKNDWVIQTLPEIWSDFAEKERGILLSIWDISRLGWLGHPEQNSLLADKPALKEFLLDPPFEKWIYSPIDACGPNGSLSFPLPKILSAFDRRIACGKWSANIMDKSLSNPDGTTYFLPHGIDGSVFYQHDRCQSRKDFIANTQAATLIGSLADRIEDNEVIVGIVATNQTRKDWALGLATVAKLSSIRKIRLWIHTDALERHWSIPSLLVDYGLVNNTMISLGHLPDEVMAQAYSACDVTLGIGAGEGFGFPIFESVFCGTPCIYGDYAQAPEWMRTHIHGVDVLDKVPFCIPPIAYRYEGLYTSKRPVFSTVDWVNAALDSIGKRMNRPGNLDWDNLWPKWEVWLREGVR